MMTKYEHFLILAQALNGYGVLPLLFGSLGLERRLGQDLQAEDIDILVPEVYLHEQWSALCTLMEEMDYVLYDLHEHAFRKGKISVSYAAIESLGPFAGVDIMEIPTMRTNGASYRLLELEDYLKVYTASSKDGYRADKKNGKDMLKIDAIRKALDRT